MVEGKIWYESTSQPNPAFSGHGYAVGQRWRFEGGVTPPTMLLGKHAVPLTRSLGTGDRKAIENKFSDQGEKYKMEQSSSYVETTQTVARRMLALENQVKGGTSCFFWIAGLSVLNSTISFLGGSITFVVGLGITRFIDGFILALVKEVGAGGGAIFQIMGFGLDLLFATVFAIGGILGRKKIRWAVIIGMVLYGGDGLLTLAFGDWPSTLFHILALFGLWKGQKALTELMALEQSLSTADLTSASLQKLTAEKSPVDTGPDRKNLIRFALIIAIPFLLLLSFLVIMVLVN